jgi:hypothetical protein
MSTEWLLFSPVLLCAGVGFAVMTVIVVIRLLPAYNE